jgi:hypothetical protein
VNLWRSGVGFMQFEFVNQLLLVLCIKNHFSGLLLRIIVVYIVFGLILLIWKNAGV